ncbi:platelet glycoprotein Ib alpha chain [Xiphophorus hellerii]|uniref:platelet glycoprotein Ib alpha chain n=1 Tax=Xiphophorus hellerii TaxID=8084 RepID=UPI0013B40B56|nr:platelet glycoprotein Ib alpha chain-like [Xiphophorus hellerii]
MQLFLLLLFLPLHGAMAASVPGCHGDRDKDHRPRENCSHAGFSHIPAGLDQQTQVLLFPSNLFSSLSWSSFQVFPGLYELDLTANQVPAVAPSSAPVLAGLAVLRLGSNRLTFLPDGAFAACPALTELYLQNNSLASLTDRSFSGLSVLEILDLTANRISILPALMLHPLTAIETLYLENNQIQVMPDGWFSQKEDVPYLYLSLNPWACSCSLGYLRRYLDDFELNIYVRDGAEIRNGVDSVVCDSPRRHQGKPVVTLEESDLCSADGEPKPPRMTSLPPDPTAPAASVQPSGPEPPAATSPPQPTTPDLMTTSAERASVRHRVTRSWYRTFTSPKQRSHHSSSETQTGSSSVGWFNRTAHPTTEVPLAPDVPSTTDVPLNTDVPLVPNVPTSRGRHVSVVPTSRGRHHVSVVPTSRGQHVSMVPASRGQHVSVVPTSRAAVLCVWLSAGCLLLCAASAASVLLTLLRFFFCYQKLYKPLRLMLARRAKAMEGAALLRRAEQADGGVVALYRSLLFVHREGGGSAGREEGEGGQTVTLKLAGDGTGVEDRGVYRRSMYRLVSREEELEGWREVLEECRVSAEDGGRKRGSRREEAAGGAAGGGAAGGGAGGVAAGGGAAAGVSRKRYSVILREEREEVGGGREELDWVVGGWEAGRGAEEGPRSSWGEWLAGYLPSMLWGLAAPPEEAAAAK